MKLEVMGSVNKKGNFNIDKKKTIKDVLLETAGGIIKNKRVKLIQVGGPLGKCIKGSEINNNLEEYQEFMFSSSILFLDDLMCPVDYMRFLTRFTIRELRVDNDFVRELAELIEEVANKDSSSDILDRIKILLSRSPLNVAEERLIDLYRYFLENFTDEIEEHVFSAKCRNGICRGLYISQCINACPAEVDVPGYVELMKKKKFDKAYALMKKNNPLSFVCGKVCARPCESRCRRGEIESQVGVRALKRFAAEFALDSKTLKETKLDPKGRSIAVVGAGPAGLSGAYYLAKSGYDVTIIEAEDRVGGMLAAGVPEYRLPQESIDIEAEALLELGVKIKTGVKVGTDIKLSEIRKDFDSILLATGCPVGNSVPGTDAYGVETAVKLLREVKIEGRKNIGKRVVVVGGGDVAMDAARTAKRLGAEEVTIISLESFETMPASGEEKQGAVGEGIRILSGYGIHRVEISDGGFRGIKLKGCLSLMNDEYNFSPVFNEKDTIGLEGESLIFAIGQSPDLSYIDCFNLEGQRFIKTRRYQTEMEGIFAAGDISGPGIAIAAIANGRKAAEEIDRYLDGDGIYEGEEIEIPEGTLDPTIWDHKLLEERYEIKCDIVDDFSEVSHTCNMDEALSEAGRCMRCDRNSRQRLYLK